MKLRIGLDFDNTLACYDEVFTTVAREQKLIPNDWVGSKKELRDFLRALEDGESFWQKIQGKVYGKYMNQATLFPGVAEFLWKCRLNQVEVFIVSHKTEYGHFDEEKIDLRTAALQWMKQKGFFSPEEFNILLENVFFLPTRLEKVKKINELKLSYFIDDLIEVFEEKEFSPYTQKILFGKLKSAVENIITFDSWRKISLSIFSEFSSEEIFSVLTQKWKDLGFTGIKTIKASGNSRVYQIDSYEQSYVLKIYPDLQLDPRKRLETEYQSCSILYQFNLAVPKPIQKDDELNWGLYLWIEGKEIDERREDLILQLIEFIQKLKEIKNKVPEDTFKYASESCLSGTELELQIQRRLINLQHLDNSELNQFLTHELLPTLNFFLGRAKSFYKEDYFKKLEKQYLILSPSDFGFHNSKLGSDGILYIYDLEYFGWDDPVKLISDFLWHPGMNLTENERVVWLKNSIKIFDQDSGIENRFLMYFPLYGIRWCLILLNEFLKIKLENRINADPERREQLSFIQSIQLEKSKVLLDKIKSIQ
ncbi:phosphotransferase [Leptospira noguchii]|uniref:Phosphotransferase enzyme family protein n=1 Tax=Leptospira noguchii serovar Autumnalis str. ZUN142 TaxID=1085540 RepID=M6UFF5_9LEPT|nr:phosphotransferase [Leptospira noguchii]EMO43290.1 phosphotransferase enzyme family protein [Leptospira noguchii serovar Autumnalis str. ZUN142]EMS88502.1 phosphotransferase enzyme family protein [Leptospira noguchii str. Hook]UOG47591.1 aminoglycoside phosphotransferase family protein [Leptospira noguchii]